MLYEIRVNFSLAALGVNTQSIRPEYRRMAQVAGKIAGKSPHETAILIASHLPAALLSDLNPAIVRKWARTRRINTNDDEIYDALCRLGLQTIRS